MRKGRSLALSRTRTVGVDPSFEITHELVCNLRLVRATSDELFARERPLAHLPEERADLAFIDGQHLFEFALRDFVNVERHSLWTSVIVFDDVLPRNVRESSRERRGMVAWAGDVFKLLEVFPEHRPDLVLLQVDTKPTGLLVVLGADPEDEVLTNHYKDIVGKYVYPDPQRVPEDVLRRKGAVDPAAFVESPLWSALRSARESGASREGGWKEIEQAVEQLPRLPGSELRRGQRRPRGEKARGARGRPSFLLRGVRAVRKRVRRVF